MIFRTLELSKIASKNIERLKKFLNDININSDINLNDINELQVVSNLIDDKVMKLIDDDNIIYGFQKLIKPHTVPPDIDINEMMKTLIKYKTEILNCQISNEPSPRQRLIYTLRGIMLFSISVILYVSILELPKKHKIILSLLSIAILIYSSDEHARIDYIKIEDKNISKNTRMSELFYIIEKTIEFKREIE